MHGSVIFSLQGLYIPMQQENQALLCMQRRAQRGIRMPCLSPEELSLGSCEVLQIGELLSSRLRSLFRSNGKRGKRVLGSAAALANGLGSRNSSALRSCLSCLKSYETKFSKGRRRWTVIGHDTWYVQNNRQNALSINDASHVHPQPS